MALTPEQREAALQCFKLANNLKKDFPKISEAKEKDVKKALKNIGTAVNKLKRLRKSKVRECKPRVFIVNETYVVKNPTPQDIGRYAAFMDEYTKTRKKRKGRKETPYTPTVRAEPNQLLVPAAKMCPCLICEQAQYNTLCAVRARCTALAYFGHISMNNEKFEDSSSKTLLNSLVNCSCHG